MLCHIVLLPRRVLQRVAARARTELQLVAAGSDLVDPPGDLVGLAEGRRVDAPTPVKLGAHEAA